MKRKLAILGAVVALGLAVLVGGTAFAQVPGGFGFGPMGGYGMGPGMMGGYYGGNGYYGQQPQAPNGPQGYYGTGRGMGPGMMGGFRGGW